jgi:AraC-like DNA-binding protein
VQVLAAIHESLVCQLERAARHRFEFQVVSAWNEAVDAILRRPIEMAVVDPGLCGEVRAQDIERIRVLFPSLPLILYTRLSPDLPPTLLRLGKAGVTQVVVAHYDDHPSQLGDLLAAETARAVSHRLIDSIGDLLAECPVELRWAIETVIREPTSVQSVQELARRARMDRRTCLRWFARAQLPPPSVMLTVLRAVYADRLLQDPGYNVEDVAARLGYAQTRTFAQNVKEILGMTPGELRVSLSPDQALAIVRDRYFSRPSRVLAGAS